jgi:hypothetical protein
VDLEGLGDQLKLEAYHGLDDQKKFEGYRGLDDQPTFEDYHSLDDRLMIEVYHGLDDLLKFEGYHGADDHWKSVDYRLREKMAKRIFHLDCGYHSFAGRSLPSPYLLGQYSWVPLSDRATAK